MSSLAVRWLRNVPSLRAVDLRVRLVENDLTSLEVPAVAEALERICLLAEQADERAREVLGAASQTLTDPARAALVELLRTEAQSAGLFALARLLRRRAHQASLEVPTPEERHPNQMPTGRAFTLGERRALARGRDRNLLDRLLRDPHPLVIRNVLGNPRITEDDVVRLAARRPTYPDVQSEIAKSPKWAVRPRVRMAIIQNPCTPTAISVPLVALLVRPELEQVLAATDVPAVVRGAARELLERRPPVPEGDPRSMQ